MVVGILPYELRHQPNLAAIPLGKLIWPLQKPAYGKTIADLEATDRVVCYPSSTRLLKPIGQLSCKVTLLMLEPWAIQSRYYRMLWLLRYKFDSILCRYQRLCCRYTNIHHFEAVESWVDINVFSPCYVKPKICSIIASAKNDLPGHQLRHHIIERIRAQNLPVDIMGRGYVPFDNKEDGLLPYHYSVVIENVQDNDYYSEKLLDCILCGTVPIFWGAPNIADYFDPRGMIICNNSDAIITAVDSLSAIIPFEVKEVMELNRQKAMLLVDLNGRIGRFFAVMED
jgi:hypothetical protein